MGANATDPRAISVCAFRLGPCSWRKGPRMAAPLRVHLADDHTMFRQGLAALLSSEGGLVEVVGASPTGEEAAALVEKTKPDVVITELDMQLKEAEEILGAIRSASPDSKIV